MPLPNVLINGVRSESGRALAAAFRAAGYYTVGLDSRDYYDYQCDRFVQFDGVRFEQETDYRIRFSDILDQLLPTVEVLVHALPVYEFSDSTGLSLPTWKDFQSGHLAGPLLLAQLFLPKINKVQGLQLVCPPRETPEDTNDREAGPLLRSAGRLLFEALRLQSGSGVRVVGLAPAAASPADTQQLCATAVYLAGEAGRHIDGVYWAL